MNSHRRLRLSPVAFALSLVLIAAILSILFPQSSAEPPAAQTFSSLEQEEQTALLAATIARLTSPDDPFMARLLVAGVLLNRLESGKWGDTVTGVSGLSESVLPQKADSGALDAAKAALDGHRPLSSALFWGKTPSSDPEIEVVATMGEYWFGGIRN